MAGAAVQRSASGFPREIAPGIWWLGGCLPIKANDGRGFDLGGAAEVHSHAAPYLVVGTERAIMIDTGVPAHWSKVSFDLDQILGSRPLDLILPTHWEVPHSGNLKKLFQKYPDAQAVGDLRDFHLAYRGFEERLHIAAPGTEFDLGGGYRITVLPAPLKDLVNTAWAYESSRKVMFTSDGFAYTHHVVPEEIEDEVPFHLEGECSLMSSELGVLPSVSQALFITKIALYWTRYVDVGPFFVEVEELLKRYPTELLAPAHGNVISDLEKMSPILREAYRVAYAEGVGQSKGQ